MAPDLQGTRLFAGVVSLLGSAARDAPLLLVLEDLHCADPPSLELVAYAARRLQALPVMLLLTRRPRPVLAEADQLEQALRARADCWRCELELEPLGPEPVAALARASAALAEDQVARRRSRRGQRAAGGRVRSRARPAAATNSRRACVRTPDATLAPLEGDVRTVVETAAVAARPLRSEEVAALPVEDPELAATLALDTDFLVPVGGALGFRHALVREAVCDEIAEPRRRGLHQRWARALVAAGGDAPRHAEVARQLRLAGADLEAVPHLIAAAADARAVAALEQACAYLEEALSIAPDRAGSCGSSSARSRRGAHGATRPRRRSPAVSSCSRRRDDRWSAREPGCGAHVPTTARSASRARCSTAPRAALELLDRAPVAR